MDTRYGRFVIFIDGSNLYHTLRDLGIHLDYKRLLDFFKRRGHLLRAFYYTALLDSSTPDWLIRLTDWLSYNGYTVITKRARVFRRRSVDVEGQVHMVDEVKGNVDIELAIDMLTLAPYYDTAILFSGDGDFVRLVEAVQRMGVRVVVVSSEKTAESTVSDDLRRQADEFIDLVDIANDVRMIDKANHQS
ncbi:MAG: NYN domain-containing protein [Ardenticatenia bacterium]|nr:NYN domain-containing protein [Ardenticatenia bacterium]